MNVKRIQQFLDAVHAGDITEEYDHLEELCNRSGWSPEILSCLEAAKAALWQARMLADEKAGLNQ